PNHDTDWIRMQLGLMLNQYNWSQDKELNQWIVNNRLDGFGQVVKTADRDDEKKQAILKRMRDSAVPAVNKLMKLSEQIEDLPPEAAARYA
ncbi:MAG: hypothetical protein HKO60_09165, partial [Pseudomonadales bacterium]|nr:hypothetical protein [Pseudomonadales bacterium]